MMPVAVLSPAEAGLATGLLCEAFFDYPVTRFVLGSAPGYAERLRTLVGFFVAARFFREDLVLGVRDSSGNLAGIALVTLPGERLPPEALSVRREAVWRELGAAERARYEAFGTASRQFDIAAPHHHLNMIGVSTARLGQGYGRALLDYVHRTAESAPHSAGVSLTTETRRNLKLYESLGYRRLGHARIGTGLETWALYRPRAWAA